MSEVLEIAMAVVLLLGIFCFAWIDYKTKMIPVIPLLGFGLIGFFLNFLLNVCCRSHAFAEILSGTLIGAGVLVISIFSRESIGKGDAFLFAATGMFLNFRENLSLLFITLFFTGGFSFLCLVFRRKGKKDRVAMGPFLLLADIMLLI